MSYVRATAATRISLLRPRLRTCTGTASANLAQQTCTKANIVLRVVCSLDQDPVELQMPIVRATAPSPIIVELQRQNSTGMVSALPVLHAFTKTSIAHREVSLLMSDLVDQQVPFAKENAECHNPLPHRLRLLIGMVSALLAPHLFTTTAPRVASWSVNEDVAS